MTTNSHRFFRGLTGANGLWVLCAVLLANSAFAPSGASAQVTYEGTIAPAQYHYTLPRFAYPAGGLTYSRDCFGRADPSPNDDFAGCLGMMGHPSYAPIQFGAFSIETPRQIDASEHSRNNYPASMPFGTEVIPMMDPSRAASGISIFTTLAESATDWTNREMQGVEVLPDGSLLHVCAHDWYNAGRRDHPSHCLSRSTTPDSPNALGPFTFTCDAPYEALCHTEQIGAYVGVIGDQTFADSVFASAGFSNAGDAICLSGKIRAPGSAETWSQGTSLYAFRCADMRSGASEIRALPIIHHPTPDNYTDRQNINVIQWPAYSSDYQWSTTSECDDIAWGEYPGADGSLKQGLFVACIFGGPIWWYGTDTPWEDPDAHRTVVKNGTCRFNAGSPQTKDGASCASAFNNAGASIPANFIDQCNIYKGYHGVFANAPHTRAVVLFYKADDLAASARASLQGQTGSHLSTIPFDVVIDTPQTLWDQTCSAFSGIAYDDTDNKLYVVEQNRGLPVIHTFSMPQSNGTDPGTTDGGDTDDTGGDNDGTLRLVTTPDRFASPNYGWVVFEDNTKLWIDAACRSQLESAGLTTASRSWSDIAAYADGAALSCNAIRALVNGDTTPPVNAGSFPRIVTTPDRATQPNYGWVVFKDGTKQWIDATCRARLDGLGLETELLTWPDIAGYTDGVPKPCDTITDPIIVNDGPRILVTPDRTAPGNYGWYQSFVTGEKQWIDGSCRDLLAADGLPVTAMDWSIISSFADATPVNCVELRDGG